MTLTEEQAAVRARSALVDAECEIGVPGWRFTLSRIGPCADGSVVAPLEELAGPCGDRLAVGEPSPELDLWAWDFADVPQPDRVRGRVHMRGHVYRISVSPSLRDLWGCEVACFEPEHVELTTYVGGGMSKHTQMLSLSSFRIAEPDPLSGWERMWLRHLHDHHPDELRNLAGQCTALDECDVVRPWRADRYGIELRVYRRGQCHDVSVAFDYPVECGCEATAAFRTLLCGATHGDPTTHLGHDDQDCRRDGRV